MTERDSSVTGTSPSFKRIPVGLIVCGPCACGKSEVGSALANHFQVPYVDADTHHSEANIRKMSNGIPLTDEDRLPWLVTVRKQMILQKKGDSSGSNSPVKVVAACSALTKKYRKILRGELVEGSNLGRECSAFDPKKKDGDQELSVIFVFLNCSEKVLQTRINERQGHFMKGNMLASQLATLEIPHGEVVQGRAVIVNGDAKLPDVIHEAVEKLQLLFNVQAQTS